MKIDNEFEVGVPIERAWEVLTDLAGIAPCLPGAQLTGVDGDVFTGKVKIKLGPVTSQYAGTARFSEKDDATYHAVIDAKGKDSRGAGTAAAMIDARLRPAGASTVVVVETDLAITGKIAQFGSGMLKEVSAKLLNQFAQNLEAKLAEPETATGPVPEPEPATAGAATPPPAAPAPAVEPSAVAAPAGATVTAPISRPVSSPIAAGPEPEALDLLAIAGTSVTKRLLPLALAALIVVLLIVRRRRT